MTGGGRAAAGSPAGIRAVVGVVSDTHGRLPDAVLDAFEGVDAIIHAGDVVDEASLLALETIAPVTAVRGNCDTSGRTGRLPHLANVEIAGVRFLVVHAVSDLRGQVDPRAAGVGVVVSGHSHRALVRRDGDLLWVNPGSASQGRGTPASVAIVTVADGGTQARIVELG